MHCLDAIKPFIRLVTKLEGIHVEIVANGATLDVLPNYVIEISTSNADPSMHRPAPKPLAVVGYM